MFAQALKNIVFSRAFLIVIVFFVLGMFIGFGIGYLTTLKWHKI